MPFEEYMRQEYIANGDVTVDAASVGLFASACRF